MTQSAECSYVLLKYYVGTASMPMFDDAHELDDECESP